MSAGSSRLRSVPPSLIVPESGSKKRSMSAAHVDLPPPETPARDAVTLRNDSPFSGATVVNLSPAVAEEMQISGVRSGVVVTAVADNSTAAMTGIQKGDVILGLDRAKVTSTRQVEKATGARQDFWHVTLSRGGQIIDSELGG